MSSEASTQGTHRTSKERPLPPPKPGHLSMRSCTEHGEGAISPRRARPTISRRSLFDGGNSNEMVASRAEEEITYDGEYQSIEPESPSTSHRQSTIKAKNRPRQQSPKRRARALYSFTAQSDRDLPVCAGDEFHIIDEASVNGWLLAERNGAIGLIPESYVTFIQDFTATPNNGNHVDDKLSLSLSAAVVPPSPSTKDDNDFKDIVNDAASIKSSTSRVSVVDSNTNVRQSYFSTRGRFTLFGDSQLDSYLFNGPIKIQHRPSALNAFDDPSESHVNSDNPHFDSDSDPTSIAAISEADTHTIISGPSWKAKTSAFRVEIHDPCRRSSGSLNEYIVYKVTSIFSSNITVTVERRFSQFEWLHARLSKKFSQLVLPLLPEKQYGGKSTDVFIEKRRRALTVYMNTLVCHPIIRYSEALTFFLSNKDSDDTDEWKRQTSLIEKEENNIPGYRLFECISHPDFNVDDEGDAHTVQRFASHLENMDMSIPILEEAFQAHARVIRDDSNKYRKLSHAIVHVLEDSNSDGAWCWREGCVDCLKLSKGLQRTAEAYHGLADLAEHYANHQLDPLLYAYQAYMKSSPLHAPLMEMHKATLKVLSKTPPDSLDYDDLQARCETVFNVVLAETDRFHHDRLSNFTETTAQTLDAQIAFHEAALMQLKSARSAFDYKDMNQVDTIYQEPPSPRIQNLNTSLKEIKLDPPLLCGIAPVPASDSSLNNTIKRSSPPLVPSSSPTTTSSSASSPASTTTNNWSSSMLGNVGQTVGSLFMKQQASKDPSRPSVRNSILESWWGS